MRAETFREHVPSLATIVLPETLLATPVVPWPPKSTETGSLLTGSHRRLQSASSKGG